MGNIARLGTPPKFLSGGGKKKRLPRLGNPTLWKIVTSEAGTGSTLGQNEPSLGT